MMHCIRGLGSLIWCCWLGGEEEAETHYEDALTAVFSLQLKCHRHVQPCRGSKDGKLKWANIEMWPMPVRPYPHLCTPDTYQYLN